MSGSLLVMWLLAPALLAVDPNPVAPDVIWLKDGTRLEGKITYASPDRTHIRTDAGLVIVNTDDIHRRELAEHAPPPTDPAERERIRGQIAAHTQQITAIKRTYLDVGTGDRGDRLFEQGQQLIAAFQDPLAIGPLTRLLSDGNVRTRRLLVEALRQFQTDEATMHLVVISVLDPNENVRADAVNALLTRADPRVIDDLRAALRSDEDDVIRNAAVALGKLKARRAAPDLVDLLSFTRRVTVTVPRSELVASIEESYISGIRFKVAPGVAQAEPIIGTLYSGSAMGGDPVRVRTDVTVYRTEVQEALIAITGQNFGFDEHAWRLWLARNPPQSP